MGAIKKIASIKSADTRLGCFFGTGVYFDVNDCCKTTSVTQQISQYNIYSIKSADARLAKFLEMGV